MLRHALGLSRYIVLIPVIGTFVASIALMIHEAVVIGQAVFNLLQERSLSPEPARISPSRCLKPSTCS